MSGQRDMERRVFSTEIRATGKGTLRGYAAVFNSDSLDLGGFVERIQRGAFGSSLKRAQEDPEAAQIHAYWNHDSGIPLGSTKSGNLTLSEDERGLAFELNAKRLTPQQLDAVQDGEMRMSFGFRVVKDDWAQRSNTPVRTLQEVELFEVSLVSQPAYPETVVSARALARARAAGAVSDWEDEWDDLPPAPAKRGSGMSVEEARRKLAAAMQDPPRTRTLAEAQAKLRQIKSDMREDELRQMRREDPAAFRAAELRRLQDALCNAPSWQYRDAEAVAYHEASHAVMAVLEGSGVESVRLNVSVGADGALVVHGGGMIRRGAGSALISLAGIAADRERGVRDCLTSTRGDRERAGEQIRGAGLPAKALEAKIEEARHKLYPYWPAVEALARDLLDQIEIDGPAAERIIRRAPVRTGIEAVHPDTLNPEFVRRYRQDLARRFHPGASYPGW